MKALHFLLFLFGFGAVSSAQNTLLWEISGNGLSEPSYLFGTMHILCKENLPKHDSVVVCMTKCEQLVIEMDESKVGVIKQLRLARMRGDSSLGDFLDSMELAEVSQFFADSLGIRLSLLMTMKPALLSSLVLLHALPCEQNEVTGVEKVLKLCADSLDLGVAELETFRYQAALFDSIPYDVQARELLDAVRQNEKLREDFDQLVRLYSNQMLDSIAVLGSLDSLVAYDMEGKFISNRNHNWVAKMPQMMKKYPCFFAVGAAHLPGENGVIRLLRENGYTVRPILPGY
jgi:uncharacterized protein YbaP (TraB family)